LQEIRWHGRGGHGSFTAAKLLGLAASVYGNSYGQAFPSFGPERRGAPVRAFTRIDDKMIRDHSQVYTCDCVVVLDESLLESIDITGGLKDNGVLIINSPRRREEFSRLNFPNIHTLNGTKLAWEVLGIPIANTVMLGAVAAITELVGIEALFKAIDEMMGKEEREKNKRAVQVAYDLMKGKIYQ